MSSRFWEFVLARPAIKGVLPLQKQLTAPSRSNRADRGLDSVDAGTFAHIGFFPRVEDVDVCSSAVVFGPTAFVDEGDATRHVVGEAHDHAKPAGIVHDDGIDTLRKVVFRRVLGMKKHRLKT